MSQSPIATLIWALNPSLVAKPLNQDTAGNLLVSLASEAGGAPVTVADGADVTLGAKADAADSTAASGSLIALTKGLQRPLNQTYVAVAASTAKEVLGATGAVGDTLTGVLVTPATTSPGAIGIYDGNGAEIVVFTGGATSVADLKPFFIPIGARAKAATTPGWYIVTGANVSAVAIGNFT